MANIAYIQITRDCNQSCLFCSNPPSGRTDIPFSEGKLIIDSYIKDGCDGIILTGGEPTLHKELPEYISYCRNGGMQVKMVTNGQRLANRDYLRCLVGSGLTQVHFSIYTHKPDLQIYLTNNRRSFSNNAKALANLRDESVMTYANIVINSYNANHLSSLVRHICAKYPNIFHFVLIILIQIQVMLRRIHTPSQL
jgi:MoaA/NifB/PqqE/SkfB family radical SAM enzyme